MCKIIGTAYTHNNGRVARVCQNLDRARIRDGVDATELHIDPRSDYLDQDVREKQKDVLEANVRVVLGLRT